MRDSCTQTTNTHAALIGGEEEKEAPVKSQPLHQSASPSTLFLLHGVFVILSNKADDETRSTQALLHTLAGGTRGVFHTTARTEQTLVPRWNI